MLETYFTVKLIAELAGLAIGAIFTIWALIREFRG